MKTHFVATLILLASSIVLFADPVSETKVCPVCKGKRYEGRYSLSLTPPNLGQFDGEIGVTPGKPFTTHRYDAKIERCPICDGTGRVEKYRTRVAPPKPEDVADREKCPECRWSGVTACKKCLGTGLQDCKDCKSSSRGGKPGWIKSEKRTGGSRSHHTKILVTPCGTCQGIGKVVCPDCLGKGATPCRKCKGEGSLPKKGSR